MTDTTPEAVAQLIDACETMEKVLRESATYETGQGIVRDAAATLRALEEALHELEAVKAREWNEALEAVRAEINPVHREDCVCDGCRVARYYMSRVRALKKPGGEEKMTDAPERITLTKSMGGVWRSVGKPTDTQYIRADIAEREKDEAVAAVDELLLALGRYADASNWEQTSAANSDPHDGTLRDIWNGCYSDGWAIAKFALETYRLTAPSRNQHEEVLTMKDALIGGADKIKRLEWELRSYEQLGGDAERYAAIWREENPYERSS